MLSEGLFYNIATTIANGEGEWSQVPENVREAVLDTLRNPPSGASRGSAVTVAPRRSPTALTEAQVQRSVETFEDAEWVRMQSLRSYAHFHNNLESMYASMTDQCQPLWKTAMQLSPAVLNDVQASRRLSKADPIPDGVPIPDEQVGCILHQERILNDMVFYLEKLRASSVRFAAHFLTDEEKTAMGANPAYLKRDAIERELSACEGTPGRPESLPPSTPKRSPVRPGEQLSSPPQASSIMDYSTDPYLEELRHEYLLRIAELSSIGGTAAGTRDAKTGNSRREGSAARGGKPKPKPATTVVQVSSGSAHHSRRHGHRGKHHSSRRRHSRKSRDRSSPTSRSSSPPSPASSSSSDSDSVSSHSSSSSSSSY